MPVLKFGQFIISRSQMFYESLHSFGIVNIKPIVPGHILVIPKRVTERCADLSKEEFLDLWTCVHHIAPILEEHYGCSALNMAIQDGEAAGQSVHHVHVHILPRKFGDFERNDQVYKELDQQQLSSVFEGERLPRSMEIMSAEALDLRALFPLNQ